MNPLLEAEQDLLSGLLGRVAVAREARNQDRLRSIVAEIDEQLKGAWK